MIVAVGGVVSTGQSAGQDVCSPASHMLFPHVAEGQSAGHVACVSPASHLLFGQTGVVGQSDGQEVCSPLSQTLFPHVDVGQSVGQVVVSPLSHMLFPHVVPGQSAGHVACVSPISHLLFGHTETVEQSGSAESVCWSQSLSTLSVQLVSLLSWPGVLVHAGGWQTGLLHLPQSVTPAQGSPPGAESSMTVKLPAIKSLV